MLGPTLTLLLPLIACAQLNVLPLPTTLTSEPGCLILSPSLSFLPTGPAATDPYLLAAFARFTAALASHARRGESVQPCPAPPAGPPLASIAVAVAAPRAAPHPALGDDESYALSLAPGAASTLTAPTVWGAMRALETLSQLVSAEGAPDAAPPPPRLLIPAGAVRVQDAPRFGHRGLMIDTGRAFLPLPTLLATLDAMAAVKLNVLHWHGSDDQAFPLQSDVWPHLTLGAMQAPSRTHTYSAADVAAVVAAASARGIRVMAELDVPGHSTSWFAGYPALRTQCQDTGEFGAPMDPTLNSTYDFLAALFREVGERFPDAWQHVGGDEVQGSCWLNNSGVVAFMMEHGIPNTAQLQLYFETRLVGLLPAGKRGVIWEGNSGALNAYPPGVVVNVWKEAHGNLTVMEQLVRDGFDVLYTTPDWYLDYPHLATGYDYHINGEGQWQFVHSVDPLFNTTLTPSQQRKVLGGEVCMWSPYEDATSFFPTVFPRAAAVAERLWSAAGARVDEPVALGARMLALRCRMVARGIPAAPTSYGGSCPNAWAPAYVPPYEL